MEQQMIVRERRRTGERMEGGTAIHVEQPSEPTYSSAERENEEGRAAGSTDLLLGGDRWPAPLATPHARHSRHPNGQQDRQEGTGRLKSAWVPGWIAQTYTFVKKDVLGIITDMSNDAEKLMLDETRARQGRNRNRKIGFAAGFLLFLLAIWGVFAIGADTERAPPWTQKLFRSRGEHAERQTSGREQYLVGVGKADITGPVVEINFMGYADPAQIGTGLRQRLYSRAFIVGNPSKPSDRFVYLVLDTAMGDTAVRYGILNGLKALGSEYAQYGQSNVAVTGTHSHSGPAGWMNYLVPQVTSKGFDKQSYRAIVDGAILSIKRAHESVTAGHLSFGTTKVTDGSINRSLYAYLANPAAERAKYASGSDDGSVERDLTLLKFENTAGKALGVLTWFPVHGTSMLGNNTLVTGDNKGVASYLFEQSMGGAFVAGFSQANVGDTTPNVLGAWCEDGSNQQCSFEKSVCADGKSQSCHGRGPFFQVKDNGASSCFEIGKRQSNAALGLYNNWPTSKVDVIGGAVKSFHQFHDMSKYSFNLPNGTQVKTCPAALGYSFAGGTTDGPGAFDFTQGDSGAPDANPLWRVVSGLLKGAGPEQKACHYPKPVLLNVGEISEPYDWTPNIVDIQVLRVGQFVIIVAPGEASTMQGRRWKDAVAAEVAKQGIATSPKVVIGGPANTYGHYIVTQEEYTRQRYEGASTLYGQWTAMAYITKTLENIKYLKSDSATGPDPGPSPPDNSDNSLSFITGVVYDGKPLTKQWGGVITNVLSSYPAGSVVSATFIGANPRNNLRLEGSFAAVEKDIGGVWTRIRDDKDWELVYNWKRTNGLTGTSDVTITWESKAADKGGRYRLKYYGDWKNGIGGKITGFEGTSGVFTLT